MDKLVGAGGLAGLPDFRVGGMVIAPQEIFPDGTGEQGVLLQHHGAAVPEVFHGVVPHRAAAYPDGSLGGLVEAGDQLHQRALGAAGGADDAHRLAAFDVEVDVLQVVGLAVGVVLEPHVVKVDGAVCHLGRGVRLVVGDVGNLLQHLDDTFAAGHGPGEHHHHHRYHHQADEHLGDIGEEGGEQGHLQRAGLDHGGAVPHDGNNGAVGNEHHGGHGDNHPAVGGLGDMAQGPVSLFKLLVFKVLTDEGFHHPHCVQVLLDGEVQVICPLLEDAELGSHGGDDEGDSHRQQGQGHQKDPTELEGDADGQHQGADQHHRGTHQKPQGHHEGHLHGVAIGGQAGDEGGGGELLNIAEGVVLDMAVLGLPEIGAEALTGPGGEECSADAQGHGKQGQKHHEETVLQDGTGIPYGDSAPEQRAPSRIHLRYPLV